MNSKGILYLFLALALSALAACDAPGVRRAVVDGCDLLVVDMEAVPDGEDIPLSRLADSMEVIQLEAEDNAFFDPSRLYFSENFMVVRAMNGLCRIFRCDGRYVGLLEGLGTHTFIYDVLISEADSSIYASQLGADSLLAFDLAGKRRQGIPVGKRYGKMLLAAEADGFALVQYDFTDRPYGFHAAHLGKDGGRFVSRPSLSAELYGPNENTFGFNHETYGCRTERGLLFNVSFCDTLFRFDARSCRILPELAVNIPNHQRVNPWDTVQDTIDNASWLQIIALPGHYVVQQYGMRNQSVIVDRERRRAIRAEIVCDWPGGEGQEVQFADGYAYIALPPQDVFSNYNIIRWKLRPEALRSAPSDLPQIELSHSPREKQEVKLGHPFLAYDYARLSVEMLRQEKLDSADYYQRLINARLSIAQQREINSDRMNAYASLGMYEEAQQCAIAFGTVCDTHHYVEAKENRARISDLSQQANRDTRLRLWLMMTLALVVTAAAGTVIWSRRQKHRQIAATRRELQKLMEQRIDRLAADSERSRKMSAQLRQELMRNHAIIRRISAAKRPLSEEEEDLLHRTCELLFPGLSSQLQSHAQMPLSRRELTICLLIRLGVPQPSIALLLDWKANTLRVAKSHLKRDRFQLPVEAELEEFVRNVGRTNASAPRN